MRVFRILTGGAAALLLAACASTHAPTPTGGPAERLGKLLGPSSQYISYEPVLEGAPSADVDQVMRASLGLWRRRDEGAPSLAMLRRRARADVQTAQKILRSEGYYSADIAVEVREAAEGPAQAYIRIETGPRYRLAQHAFTTALGAAPAELKTPEEYGAPIGGPARAQDILNAETQAALALRKAGRPWARIEGRAASASPTDASLNVKTEISPGPRAVFGPVTFEGLEGVDEAYLRTYIPWSDGDKVAQEQLNALRRSLNRTGLFQTTTVSLPEAPPKSAGPMDVVQAPVVVRVGARPARTVSAGVRYDTDVGPEAQISFEHRNLWGQNESITASLEGGLIQQRLDLGFRKPQYGRPGQDLTAGFSLRHLEDEAFDELGATAQIGLERALSPRWTVGLGALVEISHTADDGEDVDSLLLGAPAFARFDSSNDLLNPSSGARILANVTPFAGRVDERFSPFLTADATAAAYAPLDETRNFVAAARARVGSILFSGLADIPANRRLYSGGGGSVRGYQERFIGALDDDGDPIGGRSVLEAGAELRARLVGDFGAALFAEAGVISASAAPNLSAGVQSAVGVGFRYYSGLGPIRADIAFPLNARPQDDPFQLYFSIGQAF